MPRYFLDDIENARPENPERLASTTQGCSVLSGNALIRPVAADIASPDLKSPSYQDLILVSPSVGAHGNLNPKFHDIRSVEAWRCQDQVLA